MKKIFKLLFAGMLLICLLLPAITFANDAAMLIGAIEIQGNHKIEAETVRSFISSKEGEAFSPQQIQRDLQAIYSSGFFSDINVDSEDFEGKLKLIFIVKEKPTIKEVMFSGNKELDDDKLRKVIDVKSNAILDELALDKNIDKLKKRYEEDGFYLAEITYELEELSPHSTRVIFKVKEGEEVEIAQISFEGNKAFDEDKLKDVIKTSEHWFLSWITDAGVLQHDVLDADMDRLLAFYYDNGYIQAKISDPKVTLSPDKTELTIVIPVQEGDQFTVNTIHMSGNRIVETTQIDKTIKVQKGEIFSRSKIKQDVDAISGIYADEGYLMTEIYPSTKENPEDKTVDITFNISEGKITYARRISITGNENTRDKIIRRQIQFTEGEIITSKNLRRSYERINNLGFFDEVDMQTKETPQNNALDIDLKVKERLTGSITVGAGWSSVNKVVGNVAISQGNLFGRGQRLTLSASVGRVMQNYNLGFNEPWLFDIPLSAGFDIYFNSRQQLRYSAYQVDRRGFDIPLSYALSDYVQAYFTYRAEEVNIKDVPDSAPARIKSTEGQTLTSSTYYALVRDSRDNWTRPTSGSRNKISYEIAGSALGGDNYYQRVVGESGWHFPLFWRVVFSAHGRMGYQTSYAGHKIPLQELFTVGGAQTVRGFQTGALGPKEDGQVIGGNKSLIFNAELNFPIYDPLAGLLFFDAGNAFAEGQSYQFSNLRTAAGVGIRFFTPMGPIRLDWGYKLDRQEDESPYEWHFAMGTYF